MGTLLPGVPYTDPAPDQVTVEVNADRAARQQPRRPPAHGTTLDHLVFADLEPGALPASFTDLHNIAGQKYLQDRLSIIDGGLGHAPEDHQGPDFTVGSDDEVSGLRGAAFKNYGTANYRVRSVTDLTVTPAQGGSGMVCCDPYSDRIGISGWNNGFFIELGCIGRLPRDPTDDDTVERGFEYLDMLWLNASVVDQLLPADMTRHIVDYFVVDGVVWSEMNGVRTCGPLPVPDELVGSLLAGVQTDVQGHPTGADPVPVGSNFTEYEVTAWDDPPPAEYPPPTIVRGAMSTSTGTTHSVAAPAGLAAGKVVQLAVAGNVAVTTPTGFSLVSAPAVTGLTLRVYQRTLDGNEAWLAGNLAVTTASGTTYAGMVSIDDASPAVPLIATASTDTTADTSTTLAQSNGYAGPHRASIGFLATAADAAQTWGGHWTTASSGRLTIATVADWDVGAAALVPTQTDSAGLLWVIPAQTVTLGASARAASVHSILMPDPIGAPT